VTDPPPPPPPPPPPSEFGMPPPASGPDVGVALSYGWKKFQENVGPLIAIVAVPVVAQVVLGGIAFAARSTFVLYVLIQILSFVASTVGLLGITRAALMLTAGEQIDFGKAFQYDRWGEWFVFSIVYGLMVGIGLALCLIPGLFVLAFFGMAPFFFVDGRMSLGDALSASRQASGGKGLALPVLLSIIVGALGVIACFVGVFITYPVAFIAVAYLYRYAVGQPVAA
jgi:uncharacterized membrane protein